MGKFQSNFEQLHILNKYIPAENAIRKNNNSEDFLLNKKQVFSHRISLENMEDKILGFQFEQPTEVFFKKGALRNFAKLTVKHLCQSLFFKKLYLQNKSE